MVPVNKQSHLRPLATINQINRCVSILKSKPKIKRSMWSRRAQEYEAKISSGKIYDLAEVVRDLNKGDDLMIDQSYSERQLFEKAYERLKSEFEVILGEKAKIKMDKALKREENPPQKEKYNCRLNYLKARSDDSEKTINKRIEIYTNNTLPLLDYYEDQKILHKIDATGEINKIYDVIRGIITSLET